MFSKDNAQPHRVNRTLAKMDGLDWQLIRHPLDSTHLFPSEVQVWTTNEGVALRKPFMLEGINNFADKWDTY